MYRNKNKVLLTLIAIMLVLSAVLVVIAVNLDSMLPKPPEKVTFCEAESTTEPGTEPTELSTQPPTEPEAPAVIKESTATIGATGDILMHMPVVNSCYNSDTGVYDFHGIFSNAAPYISGVDYAVANLETTLCSTTNGYQYSGYPCFNCPDEIVDALKQAGFDMLLTANNHSYDTRNTGFRRTQQVVADRGLAHIGTRPAVEDKNYIVVDINGIRVGMINYTYNTGVKENGAVSLNGIPLTVDDSKLINSFNAAQLGSFYSKLEGEIKAMRNDGAEAIVLYIHWGDEYQTTENRTQNTIAQNLCNLGVDVIVGNHPHVPQPVELLTNEKDETKKTLCLYSTGNAISNQSRTSNRTVHVEDGIFFTFTFAKYSDGTVLVESARVIPSWVHRYTENGATRYRILYMDDAVEGWLPMMNLSSSTQTNCQESYDRTMGIVSQGLAEANDYYAANQEAVEASLGVA